MKHAPSHRLLICLFAVSDTNAWTVDQIVAWTDRLIVRARNPQTWLLNLSTSTSYEECLLAIREAFNASGTSLPEDIGDAMAGLILLRLDNGDLEIESARKLFVEIVDAYGTTELDAEAAVAVDLHGATLSKLRKTAAGVIEYLRDEQLIQKERALVEA